MFVSVLFIIIFVQPKVLKADNVSMRFTWTAPHEDNSTGGRVSVYDLRFSTDSTDLINNWNSASGGLLTYMIPKEPLSKETTQAIVGFQSNTTYFIAVKSADDNLNWSELSNICVVVTPDDQSPEKIVDFDNIN